MKEQTATRFTNELHQLANKMDDKAFQRFVDAYEAGKISTLPAAQQALAETTDLIGIATANVAAVVDPSIIVLGGAMFAQAQPLVDAVRRVVQKIARTSFEVVLSALGKEAPLAGCLLIGAMEARRHLRQTLKVPPAVRRVQ